MLDYEFIRIAFLCGIFLTAGCALLSPFLVLSNKSLIVDGLSHAGFTGIIIGMLLPDEPIYIAIIFTCIASVLITFISKKLKTSGDTAIGIIGSIAMAIGFIIISVNSGYNTSVESLLIGNIFSISYTEMFLIVAITLVIAVFVTISYKRLVSALYDPEYAKYLKIKVDLIDYILSILIALLTVVGIRAVGILLMSSLVIFPTLIEKNFSWRFKYNLVFGIITSVIIVIAGIIMAHYIRIPASATIVCLYGIILIISFFIRRLKK